MANFQVTIPEGGTNQWLNPGFEAAGNFAAYSSGTVTRTLASASTPSRYGWYTLRVQTAGANRGVTITTATLANAAHYVSFWVTGTFTALRVGINSQVYTPLLLETDGAWKRYGVALSAADANGQTSFNLYDTTTGADFYLDGGLLQAVNYVTTYFDGTTTGCRWNGAANASSSIRYAIIPGTSAANVGHGRLYDLDNTTTRVVTSASGLGLPGVANLAQEQALVPGKVYYTTRLNERTIALGLTLNAGSLGALHSQRKTLISYIQAGDPFVLRYVGADTSPGTTRTLEITCIYAGGLELSLKNDMGGSETLGMALSCLDPVFRQTGESALYLTTYSSSASSDTIFGRTDGAWARLASGSGLTTVTDIEVGPDGTVYACGGATIKKYDGASWTTIGTATGGSAVVNAMSLGLQGDYLYVGGNFTAMSGTGATNVARYSISGATWAALGSGVNGTVNGVHATKDAKYVVFAGAMTTAGGSASVAMARWDIGGAAWSAFATQPASGTGYGVDSYQNGDVVVCGNIPAFGTISAPAGTPTTSVSSSGGYLHGGQGTGSYVRYQITAVNATGETIGSTVTNAATIGIGALATSITVSWSASTGATSYRVYRRYRVVSDGGPSSGTDSLGNTMMWETNYTYLTQTTATSYVDDGTVSDGTFTAYPGMTPPATATDGVRSVGIARYQASDATWRTVGKPGGPGFTASKIVYAVKVANDGQSLFAALASDCTTVDGLTVAGVAYCKNGGVWYALSSGLTGGNVTAINASPGGGVWFGGAHTAGGPTAATQLAYLARWLGQENGVWLPGDIAPGAAVTALAANGQTTYLGLTAAGTPTVSAAASVTYAGTFANWPRIEIMGPLVVTWIENLTTAARLYFAPTALTIAAGEVVTIQLDPRRFGVSSSTRGLLRTALSGASDTGAWRMRPGSNTLVVYGTGSTAATALRVIDSVAHISADAGAA